MLGGLVQAGTKALGGSRFSLVNLVPPALLVGFLTLLSMSGLYAGRSPQLGDAAKKLGANAGWAVIAVFGVFLAAVLLRPFQVALVQVLEGYWQGLPVLGHVSALAIERHRRIRDTAKVVASADLDLAPSTISSLHDVARVQRRQRQGAAIQSRARAILARYPHPVWKNQNDQNAEYDDRLMPTLLGNALRDGEDNAGDRYGLNMQVVWPRLYPSLSPKLDAAISENLDLIDTTAALCIAFAVAALASLPLVGRWDPWSFIPLAAAGLSAVAYRGAIGAARAHARLLATGIDLHRFDMLAALHYELPTTTEQEQLINQQLSSFLDSHRSAHPYMSRYTYVHPEQATQPDQEGETGRPESAPDPGVPAG